MFTAFSLSKAVNLNIFQPKRCSFILYNLGKLHRLNREITLCSHFLLHCIKLDIEEVWSVLTQSTILDMKYLSISIVDNLFNLLLNFFLLQYPITHACTLDERNIPLDFFFFPAQKIQYVHTI